MELLIWNVNTLNPQLSFQYPLVGSHAGATLQRIGNTPTGAEIFGYYYALAGVHDKTSLNIKHTMPVGCSCRWFCSLAAPTTISEV